MDATRMTFATGEFDLCLCNHVLPFIREDRLVLSEIRRVLKLDGLAILNVPLQPGPTLTAAQKKNLEPNLSEDFFIENGTEWYYGDDYFERLATAGFDSIKIYPFSALSPEALTKNGLRSQEEVILASPSSTVIKTLSSILKNLNSV